MSILIITVVFSSITVNASSSPAKKDEVKDIDSNLVEVKWTGEEYQIIIPHSDGLSAYLFIVDKQGKKIYSEMKYDDRFITGSIQKEFKEGSYEIFIASIIAREKLTMNENGNVETLNYQLTKLELKGMKDKVRAILTPVQEVNLLLDIISIYKDTTGLNNVGKDGGGVFLLGIDREGARIGTGPGSLVKLSYTLKLQTSNPDFQVDSFFDVFYDIDAHPPEPGKEANVDSFFDISYKLKSQNFQIDSFFDVFFQHNNKGTDFYIDSFFDVFYELNQPSNRDSFFDVFTEIDYELPYPGRIHGDFPVESFFDVFYEIDFGGETRVPGTVSTMKSSYSSQFSGEPERAENGAKNTPIGIGSHRARVSGIPLQPFSLISESTGTTVKSDSFFDVFTEMNFGRSASSQPIPEPSPDSFFDVFTTLTFMPLHRTVLNDDGTFNMDSFFDVFTELTVNGQDWDLIAYDNNGWNISAEDDWEAPNVLVESIFDDNYLIDLGGGLYNIDSFFDVYVEIDTETSQNNSVPIELITMELKGESGVNVTVKDSDNRRTGFSLSSSFVNVLPLSPASPDNNYKGGTNEELRMIALDYSLISALVAVVIIGALTALGAALQSEFENVSSAMQDGDDENKSVELSTRLNYTLLDKTTNKSKINFSLNNQVKMTNRISLGNEDKNQTDNNDDLMLMTVAVTTEAGLSAGSADVTDLFSDNSSFRYMSTLGITKVTNPDPTTGGSPSEENDSALRRRPVELRHRVRNAVSINSPVDPRLEIGNESPVFKGEIVSQTECMFYGKSNSTPKFVISSFGKMHLLTRVRDTKSWEDESGNVMGVEPSPFRITSSFNTNLQGVFSPGGWGINDKVKVSVGQSTSMTSLSDGSLFYDSFFDVYTELDTDNDNDTGRLDIRSDIKGEYRSGAEVDFTSELSLVPVFEYEKGKVTAKLKAGGSLSVKVEKSKFKGAELTGLEINATVSVSDVDFELEGSVGGNIYENYEISFNGSIEFKNDVEKKFGDSVKICIKTGITILDLPDNNTGGGNFNVDSFFDVYVDLYSRNNSDPDNSYRVKVKIPWVIDAGNNDSEFETSWARVNVFMAGSDRGSFFMPEVDDEVLVAFEHGDANFPYIVGVLWDGNSQPPVNSSVDIDVITTDKNDNTNITSVSKKNNDLSVTQYRETDHIIGLENYTINIDILDLEAGEKPRYMLDGNLSSRGNTQFVFNKNVTVDIINNATINMTTLTFSISIYEVYIDPLNGAKIKKLVETTDIQIVYLKISTSSDPILSIPAFDGLQIVNIEFGSENQDNSTNKIM